MSDETIRVDRTASRDGDYVVVARRYRPQRFDELIGQEHVARALRRAIETGRVGHAYLFTGARGVGKTSAARILAKALNCEQGPAADPCNLCDICSSISAGEDVDVLEIDGASNRGIDEIRLLRQNAGVRPSRARSKIYIIDEVHMLTKEAFNALLKTLEEPPEHVKFVFATTEPNKIPVTILSRCQRFDFAGIDTEAIRQRLAQIAQTEGVHLSDEAAHLLARRAGGSMRDSQSLLEQLLSVGTGEIGVDQVNALLGTASSARLNQIAAALAQRDAATALQELDQAVAEGVDVGLLLDQLLGYFRDLMATSVGCPSSCLLHVGPNDEPQLAQWKELLGIEAILAILQILEQTISRMRTNPHGRLLAEVAVVRIAQLQDLDQLADVVAAVRAGGGELAAGSGNAGAKKNAPTVESRPHRVNGAHSAADSNAANRTEADNGQPAISLSAETAASVWKAALDEVGGLLADQGGFYESIDADGGQLSVRFAAKYTSCRDFCERQKSQLEEALRRVAGGRVRLDLAHGSSEPDPPAPQAASRRQFQQEVMKRPIVERAMELFRVDQPRIDPPPSQDGG